MFLLKVNVAFFRFLTIFRKEFSFAVYCLFFSSNAFYFPDQAEVLDSSLSYLPPPRGTSFPIFHTQDGAFDRAISWHRAAGNDVRWRTCRHRGFELGRAAGLTYRRSSSLVEVFSFASLWYHNDVINNVCCIYLHNTDLFIKVLFSIRP